MKKIILLLFIILSISCKSDSEIHPNDNVSLEPKFRGEIIKHTYYTLAYSEENEQAYWVYYQLTPDLINGNQTRTDDFRADPAVTTGSATLEDYKGSGYDRGHLCPAADMTLNKMSMSETFYLSNMSPQVPGFNRGKWSTLEDQVRTWALAFDGLDVATGPIFKDNIGTIGVDKVTVPGYYYKVLYSESKKIMLGLILPNASSSKSLEQFVVPVDQIEQQTGIDFFPRLEDKLENQLEGNISLITWF
ncbi:endonuclease [Aquipluma nitroreducens]|uniref:Endonuclease n=1 Tax=Aquipluma nitroreducens TaxID=2010828 RepID=A0A5K7S3Z8_9BACT|nr:DNA/RNA non-specific endonuclease [Aquipluma nitroreducens]BBE16273.1 endonuclease [Aquipluma nitroreducens]